MSLTLDCRLIPVCLVVRYAAGLELQIALHEPISVHKNNSVKYEEQKKYNQNYHPKLKLHKQKLFKHNIYI